MIADGKTISPYGIDTPGRETIPGRWIAASSPATPRRPVQADKGWGPGNFALGMAGLAALGGMVLGIVMGLSQDFTLAPSHAHLNLLGWVTLALYGLYHRSRGRVGGWLTWSQVLAGVAGAYMMAGGLGLYLNSGDDSYVPLVVIGSLLALLGMILFVVIVLVDALAVTSASARVGASTP
jgi:hypothetical protein